MSETPEILGVQQVVESAWLDQAIWSETANQLKRELVKWRNVASVAGVLGAILETLAASLTGLGEEWRWLRASIALFGAVILAAVPYLLRNKASKDHVRNWVRARSTSEALKETIFRFLIKVQPFHSSSTPADLINRCQILKKKVTDLSAEAAAVEPPTREWPTSLDIDGYVDSRLNGQVKEYYQKKGREKALAAKKLHNLEFGLGLLAVIMGAVSSSVAAAGWSHLSALGPWVAVVTTAGAAVTAHLAASRYDHEAMTYFGTANRLIGIRDAWVSDPNRHDPSCITKLVDDSEHAISTENEAWLAEWTREQPKKS
ncbi:MAG: DUF4231 domain-containing protein [Pseudomonadota bacterium]